MTEINYIEEIVTRLEDLYNCKIQIVTGGSIDFGLKIEDDNLTVKEEKTKTSFITHQLTNYYKFQRVQRHKHNMVNVYC